MYAIRSYYANNARSSIRSVTMAQYIYTMNRVAKVVPPKRYLIRDRNNFV